MLIALFGFILFTFVGGDTEAILDEHFEENVDAIEDKAKRKDILSSWDDLKDLAADFNKNNMELFEQAYPYYNRYSKTDTMLNYYHKKDFTGREKYQKELLDKYFEVRSKFTESEWKALFEKKHDDK